MKKNPCEEQQIFKLRKCVFEKKWKAVGRLSQM